MIIKDNKTTGGICAYFEKDGKHFYADVSPVPFCGTECMIFEANDKGKVISWRDLYCKRHIPVTKDSLLECIKEFCSQLDEGLAQ